MAKRRAEAVACCAPRQNYLARAPPSKRSRSDLERRELRWGALRSEGGGNKKRKWMEAAPAKEGEGGSASGKRPVRLGGSGSLKERERGLTKETERQAPQQRPLLLPGMKSEAEALRDERSSRRRSEEHEDDVWDYNSFQYWRLPLPTLNLSDIEELEKDTTTEARSPSSIGLSEMET